MTDTSETTQSQTPDEPKQRSLLRDRNFCTLWFGQGLSQFGAQIGETALPVLAVLLLAANEFEVGVLTAAQLAAFLLIGLPAGAWIDRMRKRRVMIIADIVRAVLLALIPVLWYLELLQMWQLIAIAFVVGIAMVFFDVSYQSIIPSVVTVKQIPEANGKLEITHQMAMLGGPAMGGWLVGVITAPLTILVTAGTYVVSFIALLFVKDDEQPREESDRAPLRKEIGEGLRWVFGHPLLCRTVITTTGSTFFVLIAMTMLPVLMLRDLGFSALQLGLVFSLGAFGGLIGALFVSRIIPKMGEGPAMVFGAAGYCTLPILFPLAGLFPEHAFWLLVTQQVLSSFCVLVYNVTQVSFRQRITPKRLLGRMNASIRFCIWGAMPIGALLSGFLAQWLGLQATLWIGAIGAMLSVIPVLNRVFFTKDELGENAHV